MRTAILYLCREVRPAATFIEHLEAHKLGADADLVLIGKGDAPPVIYTSRIPVRRMEVTDTGLSLCAFSKAFWSLKNEYDTFVFLNSYSRPLRDNWLRMLVDAANFPKIGIAGATASWERFNSKLWPAFPNPNIRTTGFASQTDVLREIMPRYFVHTKAYEEYIASGHSSLSRRVENLGLELALVDANGYAHTEPLLWCDSLTFRSGNQELLLIADNRTDEYQNADEEKRRKLRRLAWGE